MTEDMGKEISLWLNIRRVYLHTAWAVSIETDARKIQDLKRIRTSFTNDTKNDRFARPFRQSRNLHKSIGISFNRE